MKLTGAGVLVYAIYEDRIQVLLGREREVPGWRQGSYKWCTFSGKLENDESALHGAAREFTEEACACIPLDGFLLPARVDVVQDALIKRGHAVEMSVVVRGEKLVHYTYIVRTPYAPYPEIFHGTRERLLHLDSVFRVYCKMKKGVEGVSRLCIPGTFLSESLMVVNVRPGEAGCVSIDVNDQEINLTISIVVSLSVALQISKLMLTWKEVLEYITKNAADPILQHPAVRILRWGEHIVGAYVDKAYLEKCELRWWPLERLKQLRTAAWQPGADGTGSFRRLFLDNMGILSEHIEAMEAKGHSQGEG
jgi:ADP-ribose pyrophosphatase YjhB (NUDIX family)